MFKSFDCQTSEEIIILDPCWNDETIDSLRLKGKEDHLACPVCKQAVHVKAGEERRWHFAHKNLGTCPLRNESPNILQARSLLYKWLKSKYGNAVTVEKHFPGYELPRPFDCYVEISKDRKFGYWILERGIRSRSSLEAVITNLDISMTWVFLSTMLRMDKEDIFSIYLSTTERDLMYSSEYNEMRGHGNALNYLDINNNLVITLRGLHCIHPPQQYEINAKITNTLMDMRISPKTGEFVHPGEYELLQEFQEKLRLENQRKKNKQDLIQREKGRLWQMKEKIQDRQLPQIFKPKYQENAAVSSTYPKVIRESHATYTYEYLEKMYTCTVCGIQTKNWVKLDMKTDTCVCSIECLKRLK